jgi:uncharacterized OsmC-like protein
MTVQTQLNGLSLDALRDVLATWQAQPAERQSQWHSRVEWQDGFRTTFQSRTHGPMTVDEPTSLGGTDTAANPAEVLLGAIGTCLTIGYVLNAAARGIELRHLAIELDGDIDLTSFAGLDDAANPGYSDIRVQVGVESRASDAELRALHDHVVRTSPIYSTVARPVNVRSELTISSPTPAS